MCEDIKVPSRMLENNAVLLATYVCLSGAGIPFPFTLVQLAEFLKKCMKSQSEKRDTGGALQRFWDIIVHLLMTRKIENGKQIELDGDELLVRVGEVHGYYSQEHYQMYRQAALNKNTLMQKLRDSGAFIDSLKSHRFRDKNTNCFVFNVTKINVDLSYHIHGQLAAQNSAQNSTEQQSAAGGGRSGRQVQMPLQDFTGPKDNIDTPPPHSEKDDETPF